MDGTHLTNVWVPSALEGPAGPHLTFHKEISDVMAGEELLADGAHFFIVDGDDAVVMRKCDLSVVARIPNHQIPQLDAQFALATDRA